jgi:dienelactone hydrolase
LATIVVTVFLGQMRWQMAPAYLLFAILSLLFLKRSYSHVAIRAVGVAFGVLLLAASVVLSAGLPIARLQPPAGPHIVGSTSLSLLDESRDNAFFGAPDEKRELYVQIWYPGVVEGSDSEPRVRPLWQELYRGERDLFTLFTGYLRGVKTHSYADIAMSPAQAPYPVIVFSHAIASFAEQNTLLMEHLASHGYVVFALSHSYASMRVVSSQGTAIYPAMDKISEGSAQIDAVIDELTPRIERAGSPEERAALQLEQYERSTGLNDLMAIWVDDLRFVLDSITSPSAGRSTLQAFANRIDADRIGLLGMSFGGGAATELCKIDERCRAVSNIDGGTFGERQRQPLQVPYLLLSRADRRSLEYLLQASRSDYYRVEVAGATHLDFTDDPVVLPIFKWLEVFGPIPSERVIEIMNAVELRFFDAYLRGGPKPRFDGEFPELTVEMNDRAAREERSL